MFKKICVIGLGYIGLPTAAVLASKKIKVLGVDVNRKIVDTVNEGKIHIVEQELERIVKSTVDGGYLLAKERPEPADAFLIAVPTPFQEGHEPDMSYVEAAAKAIAPVLKKGDLVILESTSPVGATEKLEEWLSQIRKDLKFPTIFNEDADINIAYCPERVLPGRVIFELENNDRIIGGVTNICTLKASMLYKSFVKGECIATSARTAEMCKLTENSFRDINIAFANELSIICGRIGVNVWELISLANRHPRVNILQPGAGVGGHCIAVDPWFIVSKTPDLARLIKTAREVNDSKPEYIINQIDQAIFESQKPVIACLGLAFKPEIDDVRESPALLIVEKLLSRGVDKLLVVDPYVHTIPEKIKNYSVSLVDLKTALEEANIIVFLVKHSYFMTINECDIENKKIIDACGIFAEKKKNVYEK